MVIGFEKLIHKSIDRTMLMLFKPFSLKKWLCLLFIAWLAGALGGGGNFNSANPTKEDSKKLKNHSAQSSVLGEDQDSPSYAKIEGQLSRDLPDQAVGFENQEPDSKWGNFFQGRNSRKIIIIICVGLVGLSFFLALLLLFMWLGSRFKFIWFNTVVSNDASIVEPFNRYKKEGNSLLKFFVIWTLFYLIFIGLIIFWVYSAGTSAGIFAEGANLSFLRVVGALFLPLLTGFVLIFSSLVIISFIDQVVVTIMATDKCIFKEAWKKSLAILKANLKDFVLYFLLSVGLGILCSVVAIFVMFLAMLLFLLVGGIIAGILYLLLVLLLKAQALFYALAIIIGVPFFLVAILVLIGINLPFALFFKSFSLYFLSSLDCGYTPLPLADFGKDTNKA